MKVLTIAVPSYNVEKYLNKCLKSFINETIMNDLEVLIINDGSTDSTEVIAKNYCVKYPSTYKLISKENGGHGSTINMAIKVATGKYFRVVDADDWVNTESHVKIINHLKNCNVDVVINDYTNVNMLTCEKFPINDIHLEPYRIYDLNNNSIEADNLGLAQIIYKTNILKSNKITLTEKTFYEDFEYMVFPFKYASTFQYVNENVYNILFANSDQSTSKKNMVNRLEHLERVTKSLLLFLETANLSGNRFLYCRQKTILMVNSLLLIALVYEKNTRNGRYIARNLKKYIKTQNPSFWHCIKKKYYLYFGVNILHLKCEDYEKIRDLIRRK